MYRVSFTAVETIAGTFEIEGIDNTPTVEYVETEISRAYPEYDNIEIVLIEKVN